MIRLLIRAVVNLVSAAIGLLVADALLDGMKVTASGFVLTVAIFTVAQMILAPFIFNVVRKNADAFLGGIGIVSTLAALIIASLFGDAVSISGIGTWFLAAVIVWLASALASLVVPALLVKAGVERAREND